MTKTAYKIAVMQAYINGKTIQILRGVDEWEDCMHPSWDWLTNEYRIKPEPTYVPYEIVTDILNDVKKHGPFIISKLTNKCSQILNVEYDKVNIDNYYYSYSEALKSFIWQDATPFGKLIK